LPAAEARAPRCPDVDAEIILLADALWKELGLQGVRLEINSLGQPDERKQHRAELIAYLQKNESVLDEEAKRRLHSNPLRILDTKNPAMQAAVEAAPKLIDFLGEASLAHFNGLRAMLDANGIAYRINPRLVRGMDYYNLSVFEFITDSLGAQGTICAGGRYDYLIEQIGGKPAPAVGWALGVERVLELVKSSGAPIPASAPDAYAIVPDAAAMPVVLRTLQSLRAGGVSVQMHAGTGEGMGSMKSQFKRADASGARYALIFGADELAQGAVTVKSLRDGSGAQVQRPLQQAHDWAAALRA
jgi:histidyl-tRNA synthetase